MLSIITPQAVQSDYDIFKQKPTPERTQNLICNRRPRKPPTRINVHKISFCSTQITIHKQILGQYLL